MRGRGRISRKAAMKEADERGEGAGRAREGGSRNEDQGQRGREGEWEGWDLVGQGIDLRAPGSNSG